MNPETFMTCVILECVEALGVNWLLPLFSLSVWVPIHMGNRQRNEADGVKISHTMVTQDVENKWWMWAQATYTITSKAQGMGGGMQET